jgi:hypothetical protein
MIPDALEIISDGFEMNYLSQEIISGGSEIISGAI